MDQRDDNSGAAATEDQPSLQADGATDAQEPPSEREERSSSAPKDKAGGAPRQHTPEHGAATENPQLPGLAPGDTVASYTVERVLSSTPDGTVYLGVRRGDPYAFGLDGGDAPATLIERPIGGFEMVRPLLALDLRHPRLLAPRALVEHEGREYLALDALLTAEDALAPSVRDGAHLDPRSALKAGAGLADALSYLHRMRVFHLGVTPDVLYVRDGRAFLGGMERATFVQEAEEGSERATELAPCDANALARALMALGGLPDDPPAEEDASAAGLREIAANGTSDAYEHPGEVAGACSAALRTQEELLALLHVESPLSSIRVVTGTATSVGRVRTENQDACACLMAEVLDDYGRDTPVGLLLVADGMGGEARGELASRITARLVTAEFARQFVVPSLALPAFLVTSADGGDDLGIPSERSTAQALGRAAGIANGQVRELVRQLGQAAGTTLTAIALAGARAALIHVGDSRAYLLRGGTLHVLTEDHSVLARLQAVDHPLLSDPDVYVPRSMLYRSLGQEDDLAVDSLEFTLTDGDRLLLCSDGLWDEVEPSALERIFTEATDPTECARELVALADSSGGHDNSTAVVAFVHAVLDAPSGASEVAHPAEADEEDDSGEGD